MSKIENAVQWMINLANDNSHGYDQRYRWGEKGDYDCSSAVITAWEQAGVPVKAGGASYTGNMYKVFCQNGFRDVTASCNLASGTGIKRGDVLLNTVYHTAMSIGGGQIVHASGNEYGGITGGKPGDQTGREICVRSYYNRPWNYILRYTGNSTDTAESVPPGSNIAEDGSWGPATTRRTQQYLGTVPDGMVSNQPVSNRTYLPNAHVSAWEFKSTGYGAGSDMVRSLQKLTGATVDGWFGRQSVIQLQAFLGVTQDGSMGPAAVAAWQRYLNTH